MLSTPWALRDQCRSRTLTDVLLTSFPAGPLQANCYFVSRGPGAGCAIVDPGMQSMDGIDQVVSQNNLKVEAVLLTHGHFDHVWCAQDVASKYSVPVWIHPDDRHLLSDPMAAISGDSAAMLRNQLQISEPIEFTEPADVRDASDGAAIEIDGLWIETQHVPGHTPGTVFYSVDDPNPPVSAAAVGAPSQPPSQYMFSGDFLFAGSIGRTDLVGGSHDQMTASLRQRILPLPDDVVVLPGHGPQTTIGRERKTNPFLQDLI